MGKMCPPGEESYNPKCKTDSTKPSSYTMEGKTAVAPGGPGGSGKSKKRNPKYL